MADRMATDSMATASRKAMVAIGLLVVGLLCLGLWRLFSGTEHQAFAKGATPPASSKVKAGHIYELAVPGGVPAMLHGGIAPLNSNGTQILALTCSWSTSTAAAQSLPVTSEQIGTKAETNVASFTAPVSGDISVSCDGWGRMFIPDAESGSSDPSGFFLVVSILTLTIGASLALSVGYEVSKLRAARVAEGDYREDDIE